MVALHKARYFVLGCEKLTVATDHKPLLKVFGDRQLCELENPRLTILKEKAMYFRLDMVHVQMCMGGFTKALMQCPGYPMT